MIARVVEPTSKLDSLRVLDEAGIDWPSYPTLKRRLPLFATDQWRQALAATCAAHTRLGPASLVLYDVSTLYFETDTGEGFREPGFSKERRLDPQIVIGVRHEALCVRREVPQPRPGNPEFPTLALRPARCIARHPVRGRSVPPRGHAAL